jgi:hypothetical protein
LAASPAANFPLKTFRIRFGDALTLTRVGAAANGLAGSHFGPECEDLAEDAFLFAISEGHTVETVHAPTALWLLARR